MKMYVLYASMYGHTKILAEAIAEGAKEAQGAEVILQAVEDTQATDLASADGILWGSSGYFGEPNPKMANFLSTLGQSWFTGALQGKVGGVFATTSTQHGGLENICRALQTPMQHLGMIVVSNTGALNQDRIRFATPYGATSVVSVEGSKEAPMSRPSAEELEIAKQYGKHVATIAGRVSQKVAV